MLTYTICLFRNLNSSYIEIWWSYSYITCTFIIIFLIIAAIVLQLQLVYRLLEDKLEILFLFITVFIIILIIGIDHILLIGNYIKQTIVLVYELPVRVAIFFSIFALFLSFFYFRVLVSVNHLLMHLLSQLFVTLLFELLLQFVNLLESAELWWVSDGSMVKDLTP